MKNPKIFKEIPKEQTIIYMESDSNYTVINLENGQKLISSYSLKYHENRSNSKLFLRPNRSLLIHISFVKSVNHESSTLTLQNGRIVAISRRRRPAFEAWI